MAGSSPAMTTGRKCHVIEPGRGGLKPTYPTHWVIPAKAGISVCTSGGWAVAYPTRKTSPSLGLRPRLIHPTSSPAIIENPFARRGCDEQPASGVWMGGVWPCAASSCPALWDTGSAGSPAGRPRRGQPAALVLTFAWRQAGRRGGPLPRAGCLPPTRAESGAPDSGQGRGVAA
jgi:hypothetical protein